MQIIKMELVTIGLYWSNSEGLCWRSTRWT